MGTSELSLAGGHPVASEVGHAHGLVVDVSLLVAHIIEYSHIFNSFFRLRLRFSVVEVLLCSHSLVVSPGARGDRSFSISRLRGSGLVVKVEVVEVVEHEIHVFLFLSLEVVDDALVFVHFNSDVSIRLPRYGSGLHEVVFVHVVASLRC